MDADASLVKYVVVAEGRVVYCESKAEAERLAFQHHGRAFRADWTAISDD